MKDKHYYPSFSVRLLQAMHLDQYLMLGIGLLILVGLVVLYSAGDQSMALLNRQFTRISLALVVMLVVAQIPSSTLRFWSPWMYIVGVILLVLVLVMGDVGKGAQRWLDLGVLRFQPSEMMKKPLPPSIRTLLTASALILIPTFLIARQPDLGTSLLIFAAGFFVIFLGGMSSRLMLGLAALGAMLLPVLWHFMHDYQRTRVMTLLDPQRDPLGAGYHIIQSQIAIGSGGVYGRGWLNGSQSHLNFLPEQSTDFIFAVFAEEFGLIGGMLLLVLYGFIIIRGLIIAAQAQDTYARLLGGSLSLTFFVYLFVNAMEEPPW